MLWPLHVYQQKHPLNFIFLGLFTASLSLTVGVSCANTDGSYSLLDLLMLVHMVSVIWDIMLTYIQIDCTGKIVLEALILTSAVVSSLTAYTFWASKKGKDFSFLGPILFTSLVILLVTSFMQVIFLSFTHTHTDTVAHTAPFWVIVVFDAFVPISSMQNFTSYGLVKP